METGRFPANKLLDLYRIAIEEYRFEVRLNWDRAMHYIGFNSAVFSVGTGLLKLHEPGFPNFLVFAIFVLGAFTSFVGIKAISKGHRYYRNTIAQKTVIESLLGLQQPIAGFDRHQSLTIGTTQSQRDHFEILHSTEKWLTRSETKFSITSLLKYVLWALIFVNLVGAFAAITSMSQPHVPHSEPLTHIYPVALGDGT